MIFYVNRVVSYSKMRKIFVEDYGSMPLGQFEERNKRIFRYKQILLLPLGIRLSILLIVGIDALGILQTLLFKYFLFNLHFLWRLTDFFFIFNEILFYWIKKITIYSPFSFLRRKGKRKISDFEFRVSIL